MTQNVLLGGIVVPRKIKLLEGNEGALRNLPLGEERVNNPPARLRY